MPMTHSTPGWRVDCVDYHCGDENEYIRPMTGLSWDTHPSRGLYIANQVEIQQQVWGDFQKEPWWLINCG